ncbi:hypothetical protein CDD82_4360 [Ophiocordyceps australis]|uniref:Post-SET domain-containing protein n=1 Tax=Ophiocordyceps australis TaxID=1399860 RepID=A0A2C5Z791_9HYPO|nr:hypothetical protein CDD82_4360 [Ophiocordyceps australis]
MAPLTPHWHQPSHPDIQHVIVSSAHYASKSIAKVALPPFAVFAELQFPPCTVSEQATYATVQMGKNSHLDLNSDLIYINHSCEPSLIFDMSNMAIFVGPRGLKPGDELTFFYPSTEWRMKQPFDCNCGSPNCRGVIKGASAMSDEQLEGVWINGHIRQLLAEQAGRCTVSYRGDATAQALQAALLQANKSVDAARLAICAYHGSIADTIHGINGNNSHQATKACNMMLGKTLERDRRGPTSREISGEMSGDTTLA